MNLIGKLWICNTPIEVYEEEANLYYEGDRIYGSFDKYANRIEISSEQSFGPYLRTLLHEVFHAILANLSANTKALPHHEQEEAFVRACEVGFFSFYMDRRNAWFWEKMDEFYNLED